jgi:hypothetical protein
VIVRISAEDQYRLDDSEREHLRELEDEVAGIVEGGGDDGFSDALSSLLGFVRSHGALVADDELVSSDVILPPADASIEEARREFTGEGLIPE